jgi:signal transduction histidine kinase
VIVRSRAIGLTFSILGALFTFATWRAPGFDVAYGSAGMHIALAAIVTTVSTVAAGLTWLRYLRSHWFGDLVASAAFALLAGENLFALALPALLDHEVPVATALWTALGLELLASVLFFAGAVGARRRVAVRRGIALLGMLGLAAGAILAVILSRHQLGLPIDAALPPVGIYHHPFHGNPVALSLEAVNAAVVLAAGVVSTARNPDDPLVRWLGPALLVNGLASLNYVLFPSLFSYWVYSGDLLRLAFCIVVACGLVAELRTSVRRAIDVAVLEERRRLARDFHDGVAQELAFIVAETGGLPADLHPALPWIRSAAERGLYESRRAIEALTLPLGRPLGESVAAAVADVTGRSGVTLVLDVDESHVVPQPIEDALLRVARETATNAVRHGAPTELRVTLRITDGIRLDIVDNGVGFDPDETRAGFGLTSIRERVTLSGGTFEIDTSAGAGVHVFACWPVQGASRRSSASASSSSSVSPSTAT